MLLRLYDFFAIGSKFFAIFNCYDNDYYCCRCFSLLNGVTITTTTSTSSRCVYVRRRLHRLDDGIQLLQYHAYHKHYSVATGENHLPPSLHRVMRKYTLSSYHTHTHTRKTFSNDTLTMMFPLSFTINSFTFIHSLTHFDFHFHPLPFVYIH